VVIKMAVRLYLVVAADDGQQLYSRHQLAANGSWSGWESLGAPSNQPLGYAALSSSLDGRLELFTFSGKHMWHKWQTARYGGWHGWFQVSNPPATFWDDVSVAVRAGQDGRLEQFCVNGTPGSSTNYDVWHRWQITPNGSWSNWLSHGQPPNMQQLVLKLAMNKNNRLDLFAGVDRGSPVNQWQFWHLPQNAPNGNWSSWQVVPIPNYPDPNQEYFFQTIGRNADGRLEAFASQSGAAWHTFQTSPGGAWNGWILRGKPAGREIQRMILGSNADGRLELFVTTNDGVDEENCDVWHVWQTSPNNGWSGWQAMGSPGGGIGREYLNLALGASDDGRLELFATANDGNLWHRWQTAPNNGWSPWTDRGRPAGTNSLAAPVLHAS
jgi:hypothetical protein